MALCKEHRKTLSLSDKYDITTFKCKEMLNNGMRCFEHCPVPSKLRHYPEKKIKTVAGIEINGEVFTEIKPDKPKKQISHEVESFLWLQSRVLEKLAWHPEIYGALDRLSASEILDRLLGKTGLEAVPTHIGGGMKLQTSAKAKEMFEKLEKQFGEEDEKKGVKPRDYGNGYEEVRADEEGRPSLVWTEEPWTEGLEGQQMGEQAIGTMLRGEPPDEKHKKKKESKKSDEQKKIA